MTAPISAYLRSLVHFLERAEGAESPSGSGCGSYSLVELVQNAVSAGVFPKQATNDGDGGRKLHQFWQPADRTTRWLLPDADKLYAMNLLRKCITIKFQVLCKTAASVPSITSCREFAEAAQIFNSQSIGAQQLPVEVQPAAHHRPQTALKHPHISFGDFVGIFVSCRSEFIAQHLLSNCSDPVRVVCLARHEAEFVRSLVTASNTFSSLLHEFSTAEEPPKFKPQPHFKHLTVKPLFPSTSNTANTFPSTAADIGNRSCSEDILRRIEQVVVAELWKKVAVCLKCRVVGGKDRNLGDLAMKAAQSLARERDLESAAKCLQYVANRETIEEELRNWDKGFQRMLTCSRKTGSTGKKPSNDRAVEILSREVLPPLQRAISVVNTDLQPLAPDSMTEKIDRLTAYSSILPPLTTSIHSITNTLVAALEHGLVSSSLPVLAQYTFSEGPRVYRGVCEIQRDIPHSLPPTLFPLECSRGFLEGKQIETNYSTLQATINCMCEELERATVAVHDFMSERCRQCLVSVFPSARHWRAVGKQRVEGEGERPPSGYCDVLVEQVLLPVTEAALTLGAGPQALFMTLSTTIFFTEYRRVILANKHTYRVPAGRQLVVDVRHLLQWLTSEKLGLLPETAGRLSSLPAPTEMERGLQTLVHTKTLESTLESDPNNQATCSTKTLESDTANQQAVCGLSIGDREWVRGFSSLPVWSETAWHSPTDWLECIL